MIKAIHIDDDKRSLALMRTAAEETEVNILQSFLSGEEAKVWLSENECDVVFLDIDMPGKSGIELAGELTENKVDIIFLTAHTDFAVEAFEVCAADYLVKPIYAEKLNKAMDRLAARRNKRAALPETESAYATKEQMMQLLSDYKTASLYPKRIFISTVGEIKVVDVASIIYFSASGTYTKIFLLYGEVIISSESIKSYDTVLTNHPDFVRIHRSYLINKHFITSVQRQTGNINVVMCNNEVLPVAQQRRNDIFQQITS